MAEQDIKIVDVRSLNETLFEAVDISGHDCDEFSGSKGLKQNVPKFFEFTKPNIMVLISLAFKNAEYRRLTLHQVYAFIRSHFPYFATADKGWKNSVRHTLRTSPFFMRIMPCKSSNLVSSFGSKFERVVTWAVNPAFMVEMESLVMRSSLSPQRSAVTSMNIEEDIQLIPAERGVEKDYELVEVVEDDDDVDEPFVHSDPVKQPKPMVFTQYKDGLFPLVTLYSETPGDCKSYSAKYPVQF